MKYAIVFIVLACELFLFGHAQNGDLKQNLYKNTDVCVKETNIGKELVDKIKEKGELIDDPKVKCFIKCLLVKAMVMTEAGELNQEAIKLFLNATNSHVDIPKCLSIKEADPCDTAFALAKCFMQ